MNLRISLIAIVFFGLVSCQSEKEPLILISKDYNSHIENWLTNIDAKVATKIFYEVSPDSMEFYMQHTDGIVIGGGEDVNPLLYNKPEYNSLCGEPDNYRDSIEILLIHYAMKYKLPLLGICRGNQIINVVNGGTLIPDIPTYMPGSNINHQVKIDSAHYIVPLADSWIERELVFDSIWVNSRHHQSIDKVSPDFKVAAYAPDSIIESIELIDKSRHPFAVGIQWHPEGLNDSVSYQIGKLFLDKVKKVRP